MLLYKVFKKYVCNMLVYKVGEAIALLSCRKVFYVAAYSSEDLTLYLNLKQT